MTSSPVAADLELNDAPIAMSPGVYPDAEYIEFLRRVVEKARISMREGRGRSNEEVNAYFAEKHARLIAGLEKPLSPSGRGGAFDVAVALPFLGPHKAVAVEPVGKTRRAKHMDVRVF